MVYLNLSTESIEESKYFYTNCLELFEPIGENRLVCSSGPELIIDLVKCGSDCHAEIFQTPDHVNSSFWISHSEGVTELPIITRLQNRGIPYEEVANLGGHRVIVKDPSGNRMMISADHGLIS